MNHGISARILGTDYLSIQLDQTQVDILMFLVGEGGNHSRPRQERLERMDKKILENQGYGDLGMDIIKASDLLISEAEKDFSDEYFDSLNKLEISIKKSTIFNWASRFFLGLAFIAYMIYFYFLIKSPED